jgi:integrase
MCSTAENPSVARTVSCLGSWQSPGKKPEDCTNTPPPFKSTPPFIATNPASHKPSSNLPSLLTGQQWTEYASEAKARGIKFTPFSLQDCRPKGVSDKLASGQIDTQDATGHTSERTIRQVYDRRAVKKAKPVR